MAESDRKHRYFPTIARNWCAGLASFILATSFGAAQVPAAATPQTLTETLVVLPGFSGNFSLSGPLFSSGQMRNSVAARSVDTAGWASEPLFESGPPRRITLAQAKQQSANRLVS